MSKSRFATKCGCAFVAGDKGELCIEYCVLHFAAPDLLEACRFAKSQIKKGAQKKALPILRAAIAKATNRKENVT